MVVDVANHEFILKRGDGGWSVGAVGCLEDLVWQNPPSALEPILLELFAAKPQDILKWFHDAAWRHLAAKLDPSWVAADASGESRPGQRTPLPQTFGQQRWVDGPSPPVLEVEPSQGQAMSSEQQEQQQQQEQPREHEEVQQQQHQQGLPLQPLEGPPVHVLGQSRTALTMSMSEDDAVLAWESHLAMGRQMSPGVSDRDSLRAGAPVGRSSLFYQGPLPLLRYAGTFGGAVLDRAMSSLHRMEHSLTSDSEDGDLREDCAVLQPMGRMRLLWDQIFFISLVYDLWASPFDLALDVEVARKPEGFKVLDRAVLTIFVVDILLNFNTGFVNGSGDVVMTRKRIALNYLKGWFWLDFVATSLDLGLAMMMSTSSSDKLSSLRMLRTVKTYKQLKALKIIRSAKLVRSQTMANQAMNYSKVSPATMLAFKIMQGHIGLLFLVHLNALLWASLHHEWALDGNTTMHTALQRYIESMRIAYSTITFGSVALVETSEQQALIAFMGMERCIAAIVVIAWLIWRMVILANTHSPVVVANDLTLGYLKQHNVSTSLQLRVFQSMAEIRPLWRQREEFERSAESVFPEHLKRLIAFELWSPKLLTLDIFLQLAKWQPMSIRELALFVREETYPSQSILYAVGETSDVAYLVLKGVLAVTYQEFEAHPGDLSIGMWVGEKAFINPKLRRNETIACKKMSQLMVTPAEAFHKILGKYGLKDDFAELLSEKLWLGFCGRCGVLGQHYSLSCPLSHQERKKQFALATGLSASSSRCSPRLQWVSRLCRPRRNDDKSKGDLRQFLVVHKIGHLFEHMSRHGIFEMRDLTCASVEILRADPQVKLSQEAAQLLTESAVAAFRHRMAKATSRLLVQTDEKHHLIFLSHYKSEAGSAAALMQEMLVRILEEDPTGPARNMEVPVFLDSENLNDLSDLKRHVVRSHNLVFMLTKNVLTRPWCLLELVTALKSGTSILLVRVDEPDRAFVFPDEAFYAALRRGEILDSSCANFLRSEGVELADLENVFRQVFCRIAVPFSPHKSANIRKAELHDLLKECRLRLRKCSGIGADVMLSAHSSQKGQRLSQARRAL